MPPLVKHAALVAVSVFLFDPAHAQREPVLSQIDVPHDYYFREMYLPQLTTGPSSLTWSPDGWEIIYSMQGDLWRQAVDSDIARQITEGPGDDYQPDWSPDGSRVVFTRYDGRAMELQMLDLDTGRITPLTNDGSVNVEPRFAPDNERIAFVSTTGSGRFHVRIGDTTDGFSQEALLDERKTDVERYYYSEWDHQLSPTWSPDGSALLYIRNAGVPYGTGSIFMQRLGEPGAATLVQREETTWKARPDWAPASGRIVYASYLGRQWQQLWVATVEGRAEPFPLTYGNYDVMSPRWSPDASRIAYISNEDGNTSIRIRDWVGGRTVALTAAERQYLMPVGDLAIEIVDKNGGAVPARVSVTASDGTAHAPATAWMHSDDRFDREIFDTEVRYFHSSGESLLTLPAGTAAVTVWRGPEQRIAKRTVEVPAERDNTLRIELEALDLPAEFREWQSADVHVHMNYGGIYRNTPQRLVRQAAAEDLDLVFNLIVNKEQRVPDIGYFSPEPDEASTGAVTVMHSQEFHTSFWGHLGLLGLDDHVLIPGYSAYPYTAAASLYPDNGTIAELTRGQGALVGYVHPFLSPPPDPATAATLTNALPVDAALGLVDYFEVVGFADHRASAEVWYRLMNCGLRIAAAGGTDAMANYASLRGPLGMNRTYVRPADSAAGAEGRADAWLAGLAEGHSFATNSPLIGLSVDGRGPGEEIRMSDAGEVAFQGFMRSAVAVDHLELVWNGKVVDTLDVGDAGTASDFSGTLAVEESGWLLLRAWNEDADPMVFDVYPYATTTPVWVTVGEEPMASAQDAEYFLAWIARVREAAAAHPDYNSDAEREAVMNRLDAASQRFEACR